MKIKFLWTWAALQPNIWNTHFLIKDWKNTFQVDCGWWLELAQSVKRWEIYFENIFITHCHTDHFLWFFNLLRLVWSDIPKLNVYCSKEIEKSIRIISKLVLKKSTNERFDNWNINFINIDDLEKQNIFNFKLTPINLNSDKMEQHWFLLEIKDKKILFFGDEAVKILDRNNLEQFLWVDYLICEWLIPENQSLDWWWKTDLKKMVHISAKEAWKIATKMKAKNLIIIHTKEQENRVELLKEDASLEFDWNIIVPEDWEEINII